MSYSIAFTSPTEGNDGPFHLCSASQWSTFAKWVEDLPDGFSALHTLAKTGSTPNSLQLSDELTEVLSESNLPKGIDSVIREILFLSGIGDEEETVTVGDLE
jgi:hypothetical protein